MLSHPPIRPARPASLAARVQALEDERDRWQALARDLVRVIEELARLVGAQPARPTLRLVHDADPEARSL